MSPTIISVNLNHQPTLSPEAVVISEATRQQITNIIGLAAQAAALRRAKTDVEAKKRTAEERQMETILISMLDSPTGITKAEILSAGEAEDFVPLINKFRAYLRRSGIYTLKKRKKDKQFLYILDPVR